MNQVRPPEHGLSTQFPFGSHRRRIHATASAGCATPERQSRWDDHLVYLSSTVYGPG